MFRKNYISLFLFIALFTVGSISSFAQAGSVEGKVEMQKSADEFVPVPNARVDCYRIDIKQNCRTTKTNKRGEFVFLGIPYAAEVILAVSGEGLAPRISRNIKGGTGDVVITVVAGDARVLTEEEARAAFLSAPPPSTNTGELTKEQKEAQAKREKEIAEIEARNKKKQNSNSLFKQYLKEGNDAEKSDQYDVAAEKYKAGYEVDTEFMGSAPMFLNKRADALKNHGITIFRDAVQAGDRKGIETSKSQAVKLFSQGLSLANKSYIMTTTAPASAIVNPQSHKANTQGSISVAKSVLKSMAKMKVTFGTYIGTEDEAKNSVKIFRDTLTMLPKDPDVLAGLAFSLYLAGDFLGDKSQKQESLNYWTEYKKIAPKDHSQQPIADDVMSILTTEEKLKPQPLK